MKYYKLDLLFHNDNGRISSSASGDNVLKGQEYYNLLKDGNFHDEIPLLKYFHLESYDKKECWESKLYDIHNLIGKVNTIIGYYISDNFKMILENFKIAPIYHFYETLLLFNEKEIKYWIFQYGINSFNNYNLFNCIFEINGKDIMIQTQDDYWNKKREARKVFNSILELKKISLNDNFDLFFNQINSQTVVSEKLKNTIDIMGLIGFEFSELDYEIIVE